jgi:hypothetical protein
MSIIDYVLIIVAIVGLIAAVWYARQRKLISDGALRTAETWAVELIRAEGLLSEPAVRSIAGEIYFVLPPAIRARLTRELFITGVWRAVQAMEQMPAA